MSLASSPDCFPRPEDKALRLLFPTLNDQVPNTFDELLNGELYADSGDEGRTSPPLKFEDRLDTGTCMSTNDVAAKFAEGGRSDSPAQPWRKGLWCLNEKSGPTLTVEKTRRKNDEPQIVSPAHLIVSANFAIRSPRSTTQPLQTKERSPRRPDKMHCLSPYGQQQVLRNVTLAPNSFWPLLQFPGKTEHLETWQQNFQDFRFFPNDDCPESFMASASAFEHRDSVPHRLKQSFMASLERNLASPRAPTLHTADHVQYHARSSQDAHSPPGYTAAISSNVHALTDNGRGSPAGMGYQAYRFVNEDAACVSGWTTDSQHSSNSSHNSYLSYEPSESHRRDSHNSVPTQSYWSLPESHENRLTTHVSHESYPTLYQPRPQRPTYRVLDEEPDPAKGGLGIHYVDASEIGRAIPYRPQDVQRSSLPSEQRRTRHDRAVSEAQEVLAAYPQLPPPVPFNEGSPFTSPRGRSRKESDTPSPPMSPTYMTPRSAKHRSPSRHDNQYRRKSIHKVGPIKANGAETPRHRSTSRPPRTPKTPKTPGGSNFGQVDFVNFTPKDAVKLLSDVAPSGSSKTRARREQEAREKNKKLSEAALQAVKRAGGDVEAAKKEILTGL